MWEQGARHKCFNGILPLGNYITSLYLCSVPSGKVAARRKNPIAGFPSCKRQTGRYSAQGLWNYAAHPVWEGRRKEPEAQAPMNVHNWCLGTRWARACPGRLALCLRRLIERVGMAQHTDGTSYIYILLRPVHPRSGPDGSAPAKLALGLCIPSMDRNRSGQAACGSIGCVSMEKAPQAWISAAALIGCLERFLLWNSAAICGITSPSMGYIAWVWYDRPW